MDKDLRELILIGATSASRNDTYNGRNYLVVPVVALMEGVIHAVNAETAEYVPLDVLSAAAHTWNGRPLVVHHPTKDGQHISANDPRVLERQGFGMIFQSKMVGTKMGLEAWVDPKRLEAMGELELLADVKSGKPIPVSVGAHVKTRGESSVFNGKPYQARWAEVIGDHLAFLPGGRGACSLEMGCGAHRAASYRITDEGYRIARDIPQSDRDKMDASDFAGPNQSFPIKTQADIDAAKRLVGKAANPDAVKKKIIAIAKRKGLKVPTAWQQKGLSVKKNAIHGALKALFDKMRAAQPGDAAEEAAELIGYKSIKTMLDGMLALHGEASDAVDALIADEVDDPADGTADEAAEEEVEFARLEAIRMFCYSIASAAQNVVSVTYALCAPDLPDPSEARYAEEFRAAIGKAISAKNMKTIQSAHDASHDMHTNTVALGAACNGMKLLAASTCGCHDNHEGENMTKEVRSATIKALLENKDSGYTDADKAMLEAMPEARLEALDVTVKAGIRTLAATKADAEKVITDHAQATKNLADHATMLADKKAKDTAQPEPKAAEVKKQTEEEFLGEHPDLKALVDGKRAADAVRKSTLVTQLKAAGALTEEQLKAKSLEELEVLASFAKVAVVDYSGRGVAVPRAAEAGENFTPPDPYEKGIKVLQGSKTVN